MYQSVQSAGTPLVPVVGKPVVSLENTAIYEIIRIVSAVSYTECINGGLIIILLSKC